MIKSDQHVLRFDKANKIWTLENVKSGEIIKRFVTKETATKAGVLKKAIGGRGSVIIRRNNGVFEEERFFS